MSFPEKNALCGAFFLSLFFSVKCKLRLDAVIVKVRLP